MRISRPRFSAEWTSSGASSPLSSWTVCSSRRRYVSNPTAAMCTATLQIRVEPDGRNVAVLLASEKVPRAAQFQVKRCDLEPCTEVGKLAQRGEAFSRHFAEFGVHRHQQVRVRAAVGTPHATSQLI